MSILSGRPELAALMLAGAGILSAAAAQAGPQVTLYLTLPLGGFSNGHVWGLRLDRSAAPTDIRNSNPESPLNRRALADLQWGAHSALRLEVARRLTWDITRQELRQSSPDAHFTLSLPAHEAGEVASNPPADHSMISKLAAALVNPLQSQSRKAQVKGLAVEP